MLMIRVIDSGDTNRTLRLEGKLQGPWVDELRQACDTELPGLLFSP
jgi:hypothetical protein